MNSHSHMRNIPNLGFGIINEAKRNDKTYVGTSLFIINILTPYEISF